MTPSERKAWNEAIEAALAICRNETERFAPRSPDWPYDRGRAHGAFVIGDAIRSLHKPEESET